MKLLAYQFLSTIRHRSTPTKKTSILPPLAVNIKNPLSIYQSGGASKKSIKKNFFYSSVCQLSALMRKTFRHSKASVTPLEEKLVKNEVRGCGL